MRALIIVGSVLLYIVIGIAMAIFFRKELPEEDEVGYTLCSVFWPVSVLLIVIWFIFGVIPKFFIKRKKGENNE